MKYNKSIEDMLRLLDDIISDNDIPGWYPREDYVTGELSEKEKIEFAFNTGLISKDEYESIKRYRSY